MDNKLTFGRILEIEPKEEKLDSVDRKIIYALSANSRIALTELAKNLRVSRDVLNYRINRLVKKKIILNFAPHIDLSAFGYNTFHIFFITNDTNKSRKELFVQALVDHPNTKNVMEYTTKWEIEWVIAAKSLQEFDLIITKISTEFADVIIEKNTVEIIKGFKSVTLPQRSEYSNLMRVPRKKFASYTPDNVDIQILRVLCENCRLSSYEIAGKLNLSSNTVRYRIKKMVDSAIIRKFSILVDLNALDYHLYSLGIVVKSLNEKNERKLKEFVRNHRFIIRAVKVLGSWDLMLAVVADTIQNFHKTVKEISDQFLDIIVNYDSLIAYKEHSFKFLPEVITELQPPKKFPEAGQ